MVANELIYFSAPWGDLAAFDSDGNVRWLANVNGVKSSAAIAPDGMIYVTDGRTLNALAATNSAPLAKSSWPMWRANAQHTGRVGMR